MKSKASLSSGEDVAHASPKKWSLTHKLVIAGGVLLVVLGIALGVGLGVGLTRRDNNDDDEINYNNSPSNPNPLMNVTANTTDGIWQPAVGTSWQLVLLTQLDSTDTNNISVWDIDLFTNNASVIQGLQSNGAKVICYFSAGSYEDWRPDASNFSANDLGNPLNGWPGEKWLNVSSPAVREIMLTRLDAAQAKNCDGVDPDNVDGYDNSENGLGLTQADAVDYMTFLADAAHARNMSIGLKNAGAIIPAVLPLMQWSVNEQCQFYGECATYAPFPTVGKPVFNVEYPKGPKENDDNPVSQTTRDAICRVGPSWGFSSIIKNYNLNLWIETC